ncbi:MAG: hypothetical protein HETSPECPRED_006878 [Heterodermia speciosa]|uniref:Uncharacterized protein n=1 Tax=Heterodermia speciosa TaxID=116794 RepID=A0A8H3FPV5_9LECA|nr:MAG: hypothetical protein HETSPECPRED_006878 [Heterodermia speciosa]
MSASQAASNVDRPHLVLSLSTSTPQISLSTPPGHDVLSLTVHAQRTSSQPITLCTAGSVLDNGHHARHDGVFRGAFLPLTSTSDPNRKIQLHFSGFPNYGSLPNASANLRERDYLRFETVPSEGEGELAVTHAISMERLFRYSNLKLENVKQGEKFVVSMNPKKLGSTEGWWTWGALEGDLSGKKFAKWELPDRNGEIGNLMPGEKSPDVPAMEREGWVFSEAFDGLKIEKCEDEELVVEFIQ